MSNIVKIDRSRNSAHSQTRYTQGGGVEVFNNRLGWWERRKLDTHESDFEFDVDSTTEFRPDLIAYQVYKNSNYAWVVLQFNNIVDIYEELNSGKVITLPTISRLQSVILSQPNGGASLN